MLLANGWDNTTVSPYYRDTYSRDNNPTEGQCTITGILVQEIFGGEIMQVKVGEAYHTLNKINGVLYDLAKETSKLVVDDIYERLHNDNINLEKRVTKIEKFLKPKGFAV